MSSSSSPAAWSHALPHHGERMHQDTTHSLSKDAVLCTREFSSIFPLGSCGRTVFFVISLGVLVVRLIPQQPSP